MCSRLMELQVSENAKNNGMPDIFFDIRIGRSVLQRSNESRQIHVIELLNTVKVSSRLDVSDEL